MLSKHLCLARCWENSPVSGTFLCVWYRATTELLSQLKIRQEQRLECEMVRAAEFQHLCQFSRLVKCFKLPKNDESLSILSGLTLLFVYLLSQAMSLLSTLPFCASSFLVSAQVNS